MEYLKILLTFDNFFYNFSSRLDNFPHTNLFNPTFAISNFRFFSHFYPQHPWHWMNFLQALWRTLLSAESLLWIARYWWFQKLVLNLFLLPLCLPSLVIAKDFHGLSFELQSPLCHALSLISESPPLFLIFLHFCPNHASLKTNYLVGTSSAVEVTHFYNILNWSSFGCHVLVPHSEWFTFTVKWCACSQKFHLTARLVTAAFYSYQNVSKYSNRVSNFTKNTYKNESVQMSSDFHWLEAVSHMPQVSIQAFCNLLT